MFRKTLLLTILISLLHVAVRPVLATSQDAEETRRIAKAKSDVAKRGVGEKAHVRVKLRNNTEVKGYVAQAGDEDFVVADSKTGSKTTIGYREVSKVRGRGSHWG